jgi:hypothetical protein
MADDGQLALVQTGEHRESRPQVGPLLDSEESPMDINRTHVRPARIVAAIAGASLLASGLSCLTVTPASAAQPSLDLGFDVAAIAATSDGGVVAVGSSYDALADADVPHAVFVKDGNSTPVSGLPEHGDLDAVTFVQTDDTPRAFLAGSDEDRIPQLWAVEDTAEPAATAVFSDQIPRESWSSLDAVGLRAGELPVMVAGTKYDDDGEHAVAWSLDGEVLLGDDMSPTALSTDTTGTGEANTFIIGSSDDTDAGVLWKVDADNGLASYDVGEYPTSVAVTGDTVFVADYTEDGSEIREIDGTTGATLATLPFAYSNVDALATSPDGSTLYAAVNSELYVIPVADFEGFDAGSHFWSDDNLHSLAVAESGGHPVLFSTVDGDADDDGTSESLVRFDLLPELAGPTTAPTFTGTARVGQTLSAVSGGTGWPEGTTLAYGWAISGGQWGDYRAGKSLKLTSDLVDTTITLVVTGSKEGFEDHRADSTVRVRVMPAAVSTPPVKQLPTLVVKKKATPKVAGTHKVGTKVRAKVGGWPHGTRLHFQWLVNGKPIKGATKRHLKLTKKLRGKRVQLVVTGTKPGYAPAIKRSKPFKVKAR